MSGEFHDPLRAQRHVATKRQPPLVIVTGHHQREPKRRRGLFSGVRGAGLFRRRRVIRVSLSTLLLGAYHKPPCEAPDGYLWHQALGALDGVGKRPWRLLRAPGGRRIRHPQATF